jgi:hypothetical protein
VYAESKVSNNSSLKLYFLITRTVVDSKPEKVLNVYKIIDNVFNSNINHHSFKRKQITRLISIGHTFDPVPVEKSKEKLV